MGTILAIISTHAPAGGATGFFEINKTYFRRFLLTPLREGRLGSSMLMTCMAYFYSRPCGRGD